MRKYRYVISTVRGTVYESQEMFETISEAQAEGFRHLKYGGDLRIRRIGFNIEVKAI